MFNGIKYRPTIKKCLKSAVFVLLITSICLIPVVSFASSDNPYLSDDEKQNTSDLINSAQNYLDSVSVDSSSDSDVNIQVLRISASDTSGLHSVLLSLLGDYNPIVKDYTYYTTSYNGTQTLNHSIDIQPDFSWLATALLFIVVVYCFFRIIGSLFSRG